MPSIHCRYAVTKKLEMIGWHRSHGANSSKSERECDILRKQIRTLNKDYEKICQVQGNGTDKVRKFLETGSSPKSNELDQTVFQLLEERMNGRAVMNYMLVG